MKLSYFSRILAEDILKISPAMDLEKDCMDISFWENEDVYNDSILFVAGADEMDAFKAGCSDSYPFVIITDVLNTENLDDSIPYMACKGTKREIWHKIRAAFHMLQHYDHILINRILYNSPLTEALNSASSYFRASFYLFNPGGQLIVSSTDPDNRNIIDLSQVIGSDLNSVFESNPPLYYNSYMTRLSQTFSSSTVMLQKIPIDEKNYWFLMSGPKENEIPLMYGMRLTANVVVRCIKDGNIQPENNVADYEVSIGKILNGEIRDPKEIMSILIPNPAPDTPYYFRLMLIGGESIPLDAAKLFSMKKPLSRDYPDIKFVPYDGELVCIMTFPQKDSNDFDKFLMPLWSREPKDEHYRLRDYLKANRCKCITDEANSKFQTFRTNWKLLHDLLRICRKLPEYHDKVCIRGDIAKGYWLIEAGYQHFYENIDQISPIILCNPSYTILSRYDAEHNTNLTDILYSYIKNSRNIEKTAQECFLHRNTIKNKIELIQSLTNVDLDEPENYMHIIISYYLMEYFIHYMGGDIAADAKKMK